MPVRLSKMIETCSLRSAACFVSDSETPMNIEPREVMLLLLGGADRAPSPRELAFHRAANEFRSTLALRENFGDAGERALFETSLHLFVPAFPPTHNNLRLDYRSSSRHSH